LSYERGTVRPQQLEYHLDEFTFRFNSRGSNHRGLFPDRLLEQAVHVEPTPLAKLLWRRATVCLLRLVHVNLGR
jgi:hypothetical protein